MRIEKLVWALLALVCSLVGFYTARQGLKQNKEREQAEQAESAAAPASQPGGAVAAPPAQAH